MTTQDIIEFLNTKGDNGILDINETGQEQVKIRTDLIDGVSTPIYETNDFKYTRITLTKENITQKKQLLQRQLEELK